MAHLGRRGRDPGPGPEDHDVKNDMRSLTSRHAVMIKLIYRYIYINIIEYIRILGSLTLIHLDYPCQAVLLVTVSMLFLLKSL